MAGLMEKDYGVGWFDDAVVDVELLADAGRDVGLVSRDLALGVNALAAHVWEYETGLNKLSVVTHYSRSHGTQHVFSGLWCRRSVINTDEMVPLRTAIPLDVDEVVVLQLR